MQYRAFRNTDPPRLVELWKLHGQQRGVVQPLTHALLERLIFAKPYFEREGLILALDDGHPVGFVHAGFGATRDGSSLEREWGVTCMLIARQEPQYAALPGELLKRAEEYLRQHGALVLYGGGIHPLNPFYVGLYGGSEAPGVLDSDQMMHSAFREAGYKEIDRTVILRCLLETFRPVINRRQLLLRRSTALAPGDERPTSWWDACILGPFERQGVRLVNRSDAKVLAEVRFRNMEPLSQSWGVHAAGITHLETDPDQRRRGAATFLLGEVMRQLKEMGVQLVEVQTMESNRAAITLYETLGFQIVDGASAYRKEPHGTS